MAIKTKAKTFHIKAQGTYDGQSSDYPPLAFTFTDGILPGYDTGWIPRYNLIM